MTDDPTRATARPDPRTPTYGRVGPEDPHADPATHPGLRTPDPATDPGLRPVDVPEGPTVPTPGGPEQPTTPTPRGQELWERRRDPVVARSRTGVLWTGLILSALVLLFLLVFILQNTAPVQITFLGMSGTLPTGVALLLAAIAGLLLVAIPGGLRILQLRRAARRGARQVR
jgi:uncharacterized integral membrane protein